MNPTYGVVGIRLFGTSSNQVMRSLKRLVLLTLVSTAFSVTGCSFFRGVDQYIAYNDESNDAIMGMKDGIKAQKAWFKRMHCFTDEPHWFTFGEGFRAGYLSVAGGGNGCPPAVPPRQYWSWMYQSRKGQEKVSAWFTGFPYGALAAEEEGAGEYRQIQVSYPIQIQYSPEFQAGQAYAADGYLHLDMQVDGYDTSSEVMPPSPESMTYPNAAQQSYPDTTQQAYPDTVQESTVELQSHSVEAASDEAWWQETQGGVIRYEEQLSPLEETTAEYLQDDAVRYDEDLQAFDESSEEVLPDEPAEDDERFSDFEQ